MALYVVPENQELLWNVIGKNKQIQQQFNDLNYETYLFRKICSDGYGRPG